MRMKIQDKDSGSGFEHVPPGKYLAYFQGVEERDMTYEGETSSRFIWEFEIAEGPKQGMTVGRISGVNPSVGTVCAQMLTGITDVSEVGQEVDVDEYVGKLFQIRVEPKPKSEGTRVGAVLGQVEQERQYQGKNEQSAPARPPARPLARAASRPVEYFWVQFNEDADAVQHTREEIQLLINENAWKAKDVQVCPHNGSEWTTAEACGLKDAAMGPGQDDLPF